MHKNDPGAYTVMAYNPVGRHCGTRLRANFTQSQALAQRWQRLTGGTATIHRCIYNNGMPRPTYAPHDQDY